MKLYLVRHGEALEMIEDINRPLSKKGHQEVEIMASFLQKNAIQVDQVYHSGVLRAEQTAMELTRGLNPSPTIGCLEGLKPNDDIKPIADYCNDWHQNIMLVGH